MIALEQNSITGTNSRRTGTWVLTVAAGVKGRFDASTL